MKPLDDWIEVKLWERQGDKVSINLALPDGIKKEDVDEAAVFEVVKVGPWLVDQDKDCYGRVKPGDRVQITNYGDFVRVKLPNGKIKIVGRASNVCFLVEDEDLERSE